VSGVTDFIALDVETANADLGDICSIGLVHFRSGAVFKLLAILVDPEDECFSLDIKGSCIRGSDAVIAALALLRGGIISPRLAATARPRISDGS
jgi:DNA polymerase III epsilon subunit-like protein